MRAFINLVIVLHLIFPLSISAQIKKSENTKPQWLHKLPKPSNSSFVYEIDPTVTGKSLEEARNTSINGMVTASGFENGVVVVSDYKSKISDSKIYNNGVLTDISEDIFESNSRMKGNEVLLNLKRVDEYWEQDENGKYRLTTLYQKSFNRNPSFDNVELTTKYGVDGLWRSAIVPGWGQFYKGSTLKGGLILGGTVAFVGGIIYTETMRKDYMNKINKTHNTDNIRSYKTNADNFAMARNICIGGLAAVYVYNIVDAIVAPGARRIITKKNANGSGYSFTPAITTDGGMGVYAQFTF